MTSLYANESITCDSEINDRVSCMTSMASQHTNESDICGRGQPVAS